MNYLKNKPLNLDSFNIDELIHNKITSIQTEANTTNMFLQVLQTIFLSQ